MNIINYIGITDALVSLCPGAKWSVRGTNYEGLEWLEPPVSKGGQKKPTEDEIAAKILELRAEYERTEYQRQRAPDYPSITDQLDALFHAGVFPPEMAAQIQAVKDKYPKAP
jgi:hypothetical protein